MSAPTYVITGASRGLGLEFIKQLANTDSIVFALARNPSEAKLLQSVVQQSKNVYAVKLDVADESSIKFAVDEVKRLSPNGIDILINNAGIGGDRELNVTNISRKLFANILNTNVLGVNDTTQAFLPLLRSKGQDHIKKIINISSSLGSIALAKLTGREPLPADVGPAYNVSKAALNMLTKLTALYLKDENFLVAAVHPGWVKTELGSDQGQITPEQSIQGMLQIVSSLSDKDNGGFFGYDGTTLPW